MVYLFSHTNDRIKKYNKRVKKPPRLMISYVVGPIPSKEVYGDDTAGAYR
jgi:hypothetical protein